MKELDQFDEFCWATELAEDYPQCVPVHCVDRLCQVYEDNVETRVLLKAFSLHLPHREDHVDGAAQVLESVDVRKLRAVIVMHGWFVGLPGAGWNSTSVLLRLIVRPNSSFSCHWRC